MRQSTSCLRRGLSRFALLLFPILRAVIPAFRRHPCYWRAVILFQTLSREQQARARINLCLDVRPEATVWGHSWLTVDGSRVGPAEGELKARLERVGSSGVYDYWVVEPGPRR